MSSPGENNGPYGTNQIGTNGPSNKSPNSEQLKALRRLGTISLESVTSLSEYEPLFTSTPTPSYETDGRCISFTRMLQDHDSFYPVSETDSETNDMNNRNGRGERMASYKYYSDESNASSRTSVPLVQHTGETSSAPTTNQRRYSLSSGANSAPETIHYKENAVANDSGIGKSFDESKCKPMKRGLVTQEDLDALEEEEQARLNDPSYIGKDSKPLGAALGIKSSIKEYVSPSSMLKKMQKNQTAQKLKHQNVGCNDTNSNDVNRKISPLALSDGARPAETGNLADLKKNRMSGKEHQQSDANGAATKPEKEDSRRNPISEFLQKCASPSSLLQKRIQKDKNDNEQSTSSGENGPRRLRSLADEHVNKVIDERPVFPGRGPGFGNSSCSSPAQSPQKTGDRLNTVCTCGFQSAQAERMALPGGAMMQAEEIDSNNSLGTGYGQFSYTTPSDLVRKHEESTQQRDQEERAVFPGTGNILNNGQPDKNQQDDELRANLGLGPGYGQFSYTTPSELIKRKEEEESNRQQFPEMTSSQPGYEFFKNSSFYISPSKKESEGSNTRTDSVVSIPSSTRRRLVDWSTQSDVTAYFNRLSDMFQNAARFSTSVSEPRFIRVFVESVASSLLETSQSEESGFDEMSTGDSDDDSFMNYMERAMQLLQRRLSFGYSGTTMSPNDSRSEVGPSFITLDIQDESEENQARNLEFSESFTSLCRALFEMDPRVALNTVESDSHLMPPRYSQIPGARNVSSSLSGWSAMSDGDLKSQRSSGGDIRNLQLEKESLESHVRKLQIENTTLRGENKVLKQNFDNASARINDLEEKLKASQNELANFERSMNIEISEVCRKNKLDMERDLEEQQRRIGCMHRENDSLKSEISSLEKQMSTVKREADYLRSSGDKNKALEAYIRESELLNKEVDKLKELLRESDTQVKALTTQQSESSVQLIQVSKVRDMLEQQLTSGGSLAQKQALREMKNDYETKIRQIEEKMDDLRSEKQTLEQLYKDQLTSLTKERHEAFGKLKTLNDMMDAIRCENESLRDSLRAGFHQDKQPLIDQSEINRLTMEMRNLEGIVSELRRTVKQQTTELTTVRAQLDSRNKCLQDANSELAMLTSRISLDDSSIRKQQKIDRLTSQITSMQTEMKTLTEKCGILGAENSRLEQKLDNASRQLSNCKAENDTKANEKFELKLSFLQAELNQKESQLEKINSQFKKTESNLQQLRQELFYHQEHTNNLQSQVNGVRDQLDQKSRLLEEINKSEHEKVDQIEIMKHSVDTLNIQLSNKQAELQVTQLELSQMRDMNERLEHQLSNMGQPSPRQSPSASELKISQLLAELDKRKAEILKLTSALNVTEGEHQLTLKELSKTRELLAAEKANLVHITSEKSKVQNKLQTLSEERDVLLEEKSIDEGDLNKLEQKLREVLQRFEEETLKRHDKNIFKHGDTAEARQLISEMNSLSLLLDGKDREIEMLNDKLHRNQVEMSFLHRRVEYLGKESDNNKASIDKITQQLIHKMKENSTTHEVNLYLSKEKTNLERDISILQKDLKSEKNYIQTMKDKINSVLKKIDQTEMNQQSTMSEMMAKDGRIASLQTEVANLESNTRQLENDLVRNRHKLNQLNEEIRNITNTKTTLENQLATERKALEQERSLFSKKKDEAEQTLQKLDAVKHEQSFLLNNLNSERKNLELLKEEIVQKGLVEHRLSREIEDLRKEKASLEVELSSSHTTVEQIKKEKTNVTREQKELTLKIREKEREIAELREREAIIGDTIRREASVEKCNLDQEKAQIARELQFAKEEVAAMNEKLQQKDLQLNSFGKTLQELEELKRKKIELENKIEKAEIATSDTRLLIDSQRSEIISLRKENSKLQESFAKSQVNCHTMQDELRIVKETTDQQITELKATAAKQKEQLETEKYLLREALTKCEATLRGTENNLQQVSESKTALQNAHRSLEYSFNEAKSQLATETTERKLAQQKVENLQTTVEDMKQHKHAVEERILEMQAIITKTEGEVQKQKDKVNKMIHMNQELEATVHVNDSTIRAKQEQIESLQSEICKLQQLMDTQKQQLNTKLRKFTLELKSEKQIQQQEVQTLSQQASQLSVELEKAREQIALKNKENLKLQEEILVLEEQKRDMNSELRLSRDSLKSEELMQCKLTSKYTEQEDELKRMKAKWAKQAEDAGDGDPKTMWRKMNQVIQELSNQMQMNFTAQQEKDKEAKERETKVIHRYKKQIGEVTSQLNTEKALHEITKNSLRALEEDCSRLRQLMHSARRKTGSPEKKPRSRIEEINEIISRSQTQAQSMLASGTYLDSSFKHISPSRDYNINSNCERSRSPDTCSQVSDCSFGSAGALNNSYNISAPKSSNTPRK